MIWPCLFHVTQQIFSVNRFFNLYGIFRSSKIVGLLLTDINPKSICITSKQFFPLCTCIFLELFIIIHFDDYSFHINDILLLSTYLVKQFPWYFIHTHYLTTFLRRHDAPRHDIMINEFPAINRIVYNF